MSIYILSWFLSKNIPYSNKTFQYELCPIQKPCEIFPSSLQGVDKNFARLIGLIAKHFRYMPPRPHFTLNYMQPIKKNMTYTSIDIYATNSDKKKIT